MHQYLDLVRRVLDFGEDRSDRTGTGTRCVFGTQLHFDLQASFPLLTERRIHVRSVIYELLWFLRGETNVRWLQERGVSIWDEWAAPDGELGDVYGAQWRSWPAPDGRRIDQLAQVIREIQVNPASRRLIVSAWNVAALEGMALPPCHLLFQFDVSGDRLNCQVYQRSVDLFLGAPYNVASYALLTHMVAQVCGLQAGTLVWTGGNVHLYRNHFNQARTLVSRDARTQLSGRARPTPVLTLNPAVTTIDGFTASDITLTNYHPWPAIPAPVSV